MSAAWGYRLTQFGFVATLNAIPYVAPSTGVIIFFVASLLKDTVDRIGDFLDNGKSDWRV